MLQTPRPGAKVLNVEGFDSLAIWEQGSKSASRAGPSWIRHAKRYIAEYCTYVGRTPDQLVLERKRGLRRDPDWSREEDWLNRWHQELLKRHTPGTAQLKYTAVVAFFLYNHKPLSIPRFPRVDKSQYKGYKRLRREEIQRLLQFSQNHRTKLLLMIGAESGLRVRALSAMTLGCFVASEADPRQRREALQASHWRDLEDAPMPLRIELPREFYTGTVNKREGITFVCADAVQALVESLKDREERGEKITGDSPVFPNYDAVIELPGKGQLHTVFSEYHPVASTIVTKQPRKDSAGNVRILPVSCKVVKITPRKASSSTLEYDMQTARTRAGLTHGPSERPATPHSLRKFLQTSLDLSNVNTTMSNIILGHSNRILEHYSGHGYIDIAEIREAYAAAMDRISVTQAELDPATVTRLQKQAEKYGHILERLERLERQGAKQELIVGEVTPLEMIEIGPQKRSK